MIKQPTLFTLIEKVDGGTVQVFLYFHEIRTISRAENVIKVIFKDTSSPHLDIPLEDQEEFENWLQQAMQINISSALASIGI